MARRTHTLIVGGGFAGTVLAKNLRKANIDCLVLDRGEEIDVFELRARLSENVSSEQNYVKIRKLYESRIPGNVADYLGPECSSEYIVIGGGCSNHWGGLSFRLSPELFDHGAESRSAWPFSYSELVPYYERAEKELKIAIDLRDPEKRVDAPTILGADGWSAVYSSHFPRAYFGAQAHNLGWADDSAQGMCAGAGDCELCPMDAKTRAAHLKGEVQIEYESFVEKLVFDGEKAVSAICMSPSGRFVVDFERVVIAAHGVESCKLLWRSDLPPRVRQSSIGTRYQDHAVAEFAIELAVEVPHLQVNTATQMVIPELSGSFEGIHFTTLGLLVPPAPGILSRALNVDLLNEWNFPGAAAELRRIMALYVMLEIPPSWNVHLALATDGSTRVATQNYFENCGVYDSVLEHVQALAEGCGTKIVPGSFLPHYRGHFGTHHLVGTLGMGEDDSSVLGPDFKVIGTENVYAVGASVFPRCGSRNPTLTVVALALKLADELNQNGANETDLRP